MSSTPGAAATPDPANNWAAWAACFMAILAYAAALRLVWLGSLPPGLYFDEAWYCLDALSVGGGNWPVFFPGNYGREPLYMYFLSAMFAGAGPGVVQARAASALIGVAAVAAVYPVARRVVGPRGALAAMFVLATLRWHLHFSRAIFRTILTPLFACLFVWLVFRWSERRRVGDAALAGAVLGAGLMTYTAFRMMPLLLALWLAWLWAKGRLSFRRDGPSLAAMVTSALLVSAPMSFYFMSNPGAATERTGGISLFHERVTASGPDGAEREVMVPKPLGRSLADIVANAQAVVLSFGYRGDHVARHNLPGAPVLDWASALVFLVGLGWCVVRARSHEAAFVLLAWLVLMSITSVFSFGAPNLLRMLGMAPAVAIVFVIGLRVVAGGPGMFHRRSAPAMAAAAGLILLFAALQLHSYFVRFARHPEVRQAFLADMFHDPAQAVAEAAPFVEQVYVPREFAEHPTVRFVTSLTPNLTPYDADHSIPTAPGGKVAVLLTQRSMQIAAGEQKAALAALEARPEGAARVMTVPAGTGPDGQPAMVPWAWLFLCSPGPDGRK